MQNQENIELKNAGLKVTVPRMKILHLLEKQVTKRHFSAEDIYKILLFENEDIGLATVYRVLTQFEAAGLVTRHHFESGNSVFELDNGGHHDHLVCVKCGKVDEFKMNLSKNAKTKSPTDWVMSSLITIFIFTVFVANVAN